MSLDVRKRERFIWTRSGSSYDSGGSFLGIEGARNLQLGANVGLLGEWLRSWLIFLCLKGGGSMTTDDYEGQDVALFHAGSIN